MLSYSTPLNPAGTELEARNVGPASRRSGQSFARAARQPTKNDRETEWPHVLAFEVSQTRSEDCLGVVVQCCTARSTVWLPWTEASAGQLLRIGLEGLDCARGSSQSRTHLQTPCIDCALRVITIRPGPRHRPQPDKTFVTYRFLTVSDDR